ncbi:MAG: hybrid sensor histidine kinase/response regulator [Rhodospirillales bacterium]|nr:hybrid sensor histidine kinase/response regulator [Rhodospirillales bacterium]
MKVVQRQQGDPATTRILELEREVLKLNRIRQVLTRRVERDMDGQGSAFSLFQTASVLEAQVKARTSDLQETLSDLEKSYQEAARAREQAETARLRLLAAIESISEGFALFDASDHLILYNQTYLVFWPDIADKIHVGMGFAEMASLAVKHKCIIDAYRDPDDWVRRRSRQHSQCLGPSIHALSDGRWMQVNERRTHDGGIASVYTDITSLKHQETLLREAELAKKSHLLQATLDSIFQGVAVYDSQLKLVAWNNEFVRLLDLPSRCVRRGAVFADFYNFNVKLGAQGIRHPNFLDPGGGPAPLKFEHSWPNGRVLDIERNPMPGGGFILLFTDITRRKQTEEALRDGERRIRLVTDAMPALIAYADADERYQFVNEPYRQWLGLPVDKIVGRPMGEVLSTELYARRKKFVNSALSGQIVNFEVELTPSGIEESRYASVNFVPHRGEGDEILGFFTLMQDITERRRIDAALKEANETLERRVGERTAALTLLNDQLRQEITERLEVEKALYVAKSEAEQANLSKTRFLAAASHDLLQPLNAARLFVSALAELKHAPRIRMLIDNVDASLHAVEDLLATLLDISKLDAGAVSPEIIDFPIATLLGPLATEHMVQARDRGLTLRYVPSRAVVQSDVRLLRRIIQNLLSNAIRYTQSGGVLLGCRHCGDGIRIEVWDTGSGIPSDKLDEIFEEFRQLHPGNEQGGRGIGLGLAIVKRAAKMLDHSLHTRSAVGKGSMFSVTVRLGTQPLSVARPLQQGRAGRDLSGAAFLVIDDQRSILAGMQALLSGWGCSAGVAASGQEAIDILPQLGRAPDVIIADYHLDDGATGVAEINRIRRVLNRPVPGIIVTADHTPTIQRLVKQQGFWLLKKPLNPAQLRSLLSSILG